MVSYPLYGHDMYEAFFAFQKFSGSRSHSPAYRVAYSVNRWPRLQRASHVQESPAKVPYACPCTPS